LTEFVAFPTPLWYIRQLLFWFLSVQLRSDVQRLRADLPRSDAVRLSPTCTYNLMAAECCNQETAMTIMNTRDVRTTAEAHAHKTLARQR
jgi:hypothetical protein